jgi:hypothetical protein
MQNKSDPLEMRAYHRAESCGDEGFDTVEPALARSLAAYPSVVTPGDIEDLLRQLREKTGHADSYTAPDAECGSTPSSSRCPYDRVGAPRRSARRISGLTTLTGARLMGESRLSQP